MAIAVCIYSNINRDVAISFKIIDYEMGNANTKLLYPDISKKRYSNNGQIVDADDEYLSTSDKRNTNWLFRIDIIALSKYCQVTIRLL